MLSTRALEKARVLWEARGSGKQEQNQREWEAMEDGWGMGKGNELSDRVLGRALKGEFGLW